jgi:hypothetical protein
MKFEVKIEEVATANPSLMWLILHFKKIHTNHSRTYTGTFSSQMEVILYDKTTKFGIPNFSKLKWQLKPTQSIFLKKL